MTADSGRPAPLGATVCTGGVNFSVFPKNAARLELLLFDHVNAAAPSRVIALDPASHRTSLANERYYVLQPRSVVVLVEPRQG